MKKCLLLMTAIVLWNIQVAGSQPDDSESSYRQALALVKNAQFFEAQNLFQKALKKNPFNIPSRRGLDLLKDLNNGIIFPAAMPAIVSGLEYTLDYNHKEAAQEFRKALEIAPDYYYLLHNLGTSLYKIGQTDNAIVELEKALKQKEDYPYTHNNLGLALHRAGRYKEALIHYQRAITLFPQYHKTYNNMAITYLALHMEKEGQAMLRKALEINSGYVLAFQNFSTPEDKGSESAADSRQLNTAMDAASPVPTEQLLETLEKGPVLEKKKAQEELCIRKDPASINDLLRKLKNPSPLLRAAAAEILGDMKAAEALAALVRLANDANWNVRWAVVHALGQINDPSALPVLLGALQDPDYHVRASAVCAAVMSQSPLAVEPLLKMLDDAAPGVREAGLSCLPYMNAVIPRETTMDLLKNDRSIHRTLGAKLVKQGEIPLETDEEKAFFLIASNQWQKITNMGSKAISTLRTALEYHDPESRIQAVATLSKIGSPDTLKHFFYALDDRDARVKAAACKALQRLTSKNLQTVEQWREYFKSNRDSSK